MMQVANRISNKVESYGGGFDCYVSLSSLLNDGDVVSRSAEHLLI